MLPNKPIGGYFELELELNKEYYSNYYRFNLARNAIAFFFISKKIASVYIPTYICDSVINSLIKNNIEIKYYNIKNILKPRFPEINDNEGLLIVNHFDLHENFSLKKINNKENVLIDNSQAFFNDRSINSVFSPRKYFGITDGSYLKTSQILKEYEQLPFFSALPYIEPLIKRIDSGAEEGFESYKSLHLLYSSVPVMKMSHFSKRVLESIDYDKIKKKRQENFSYLHNKLSFKNEIHLVDKISLFCYPFLSREGGLIRDKLISKKIFTPQYWSSVLTNEYADKYDIDLVKNIVHLPIDHRYGIEEMKTITNWILNR